jgi:ABC-2 type transport system permease protein
VTAARAIVVIALTELRRVGRDRMALFFAIVLPVVIIVIIGTTFGAQDEDIQLGVVDRDRSGGSEQLVDTLDGADGVAVERFDSLDGMRRDVRAGAVAAGVVVPPGYGDRLDGGGSADVELVVDPTSSAATAVRATIEAAVADEAALTAASRFAAEHGGGDLADARDTARRLVADLPRATIRTVSVDEGPSEDVGTFSYTAPSNLVLFVFVNTLAVGAILALDRQRGIVRRLLSTPHGTGTILAGIGAAKLAFAVVQSALILTVGGVVFGVDWGDPLAAGLLTLVWAVLATAAGLLLGSMATGADQAQAAAVPVAIGLAMLGGCMWSLEVVPGAMRIAGHVAPHAWAMDAWIALVFDGAGLGGIAVELAVLTAVATVLSGAAAWRLRLSLTR